MTRKAEKLDSISKVLEGINIQFPANLNILLDKNVSNLEGLKNKIKLK